jgi:hypothetical protein
MLAHARKYEKMATHTGNCKNMNLGSSPRVDITKSTSHKRVVRNNFIDYTNNKLLLEKQKLKQEKLLLNKKEFFDKLRNLEYIERAEEYSKCNTKVLEKYYNLEIKELPERDYFSVDHNETIRTEIFEELSFRYKEGLKSAIS